MSKFKWAEEDDNKIQSSNYNSWRFNRINSIVLWSIFGVFLLISSICLITIVLTRYRFSVSKVDMSKIEGGTIRSLFGKSDKILNTPLRTTLLKMNDSIMKTGGVFGVLALVFMIFASRSSYIKDVKEKELTNYARENDLCIVE